ncbi:MAG: DUF4198 domain-containing protein [Deltaproteobacteria bacterium]|jgi:uncharacterized GH25 family protein|nr:DUF4198 domain-containing protein [Deltaproteobacteria bacterium]
MRKTLLPALAALLLTAAPAAGHDFWASAPGAAAGSPVTVVFGYGHGFPDVEAAEDADFETRFQAPRLVGADGKDVPLSKGKDAMTYVTQAPLPAGTYFALTRNKPGFGSRTPDGYRRGSRKDNPDAVTCTISYRFGKEVLALGGPAQGYDKPQGQEIEIVPQKDPSSLKAGEPFPVKVLFRGKPSPGTEVKAFFAGFTKDNVASAFAAQADKEGLVNIIPLAPGDWLAKAGEEADYSDKATCDRESYGASLTFKVQ